MIRYELKHVIIMFKSLQKQKLLERFKKGFQRGLGLCELNQLKFNREPVEGHIHRGDVIIPLCPGNELRSSVLNPLQTWEGALAVPNYK